MHLKSFNIPCFIYYPKPIHLLDAMKKYGYQEGDFPISEIVSKRIFAIPMHPYLEKTVTDKVCCKIMEFIK